MLTIRLSRIGKRKQPMYRLIISEKSRDPQAKVLEILGSYNPFSKELNAKGERINYWISKGSGISPTVNNLLIAKGIIKGEKVTASKTGKKKADIIAEKVAKKTGTPADAGEVKAEAAPADDAKAEENKEEKPAEAAKEEAK